MDCSSFPVLANSIISEENVNKGFEQTSSECLDVIFDLNKIQNNSGKQISKSEEISEKLPLSTCSSADLSLQNSGLLENPSDVVGGSSFVLKAQDKLSHPALDKSRSLNPIPEVSRENSCPCFLIEPLKYPCGHMSSLSMEATSGNIVGDLTVDAEDFVVKNKGNDKVVAYICLPDDKQNSSESNHLDEGDDSDLVEHDVKVCDICGDAGREDLLAICCRCSDGAEHTYCMREMVDRVPEGDWLCEECKSDVEIKSQNEERVCSVDGSEKINSSGLTISGNLNIHKKFEAKSSDVDEKRTYNDRPSAKILGKRFQDDVEVCCPAKRHALEPDNGSAKISISRALPAISRDSSFKLERWKTKHNRLSSSDSLSAPESANSPASASQLEATQGIFIKSNSFNSSNVKPKVKLVDDVIPQKQRSIRESSSLNSKEGASRSINRSVSFKLPNNNMARLTIGEPKVKMLSPKFSDIQENKGSKYIKDRKILGRKNSFQFERLSVSPSVTSSGCFAAKNDQKIVSFGDPNSLHSPRKLRDARPMQSDNRSTLLSKSSSFGARRGLEPSVSQGEVKGQSSAGLVSSANGDNNHDLKPNQGCLKVDSLSSSCFAERPPCSAGEALPDGLSLQKESTYFGERANDSISSRSKQSRHIFSCQKIDYSVQSCTADNPGSSSFDITATKNPREVVDGKDKLKAVIEAAVLRKPGIYRKHMVSDRYNEVSGPRMNSEIASQGQVSDSSNRGNASTSEEMQEEGQMVLGSSITDLSKQETLDSNVKQFLISSLEASSSRMGESYSLVPLEPLSLIRDIPNHISEGTSILFKRLAIPDNEYIWQGIFEVHRIGRTINLFDGIQAHLSACASPKVLEAVSKFNYKVLLNEVPRMTMWPVQFQENGVKEDNIAIFFFAKDLTSYEKSYKGLLHNMMKNDVALKGSFDGFELMIFSSNQLPEKSQRWNTLFFMWGVFRGKRYYCSEHVLGSDNQNFVPQGRTWALPSEDRASELTCLSSSEALKDVYENRLSSEIMHNGSVQTEQPLDYRLNSSSFPVVQSSIAKSCQETADTSTSLENGIDSDKKMEPELDAYVESAGSAYAPERGTVDNICEKNLLDKKSSGKDEASLLDRSMHESPPGSGNQMLTECYTKVDFVGTGHVKPGVAASDGTSHVNPEVPASDGTMNIKPGVAAEDIAVTEGCLAEERKTDCCVLYGVNDQTSCSRSLSSETCGVASGSPAFGAVGWDGFRGFKGSAERYFFPVDRLPEWVDAGMVRKLIPLKTSDLGEDRFHDRAPNLELALGAKNKTLGQGTPRLSVGKQEEKIIPRLSSPEAATKEDEDDLSASLSLSLSFPFPDKEPMVKSTSKTEQLMPEKQHANTALHFGLQGGLGQVESRRSTFLPGRNYTPHG